MGDFRVLLAELASSRTDALPSKKRVALVETVLTAISSQEDPGVRKLLAEWNELKCSSAHGHRRVLPLYGASLSKEAGDETTIRGLCENMTRMLSVAADPELVESCRADLLTCFGKNNNEAEKRNQLVSVLEDIAKTDSSGAVPAVVLGFALDHESRKEVWLNILLQHSVTQFSDSSELRLARTFLRQVNATEWKETVSPALQLKLRSHPDKSLQTVLGWMEHGLAAVADATENDATNEWIPLLLKHLQSPSKEVNRDTARNILVCWAKVGPSASLESIATALAGSVPVQAVARQSVYEALDRIAANPSSSTTTTTTIEVSASATLTVLEGLVNMLSKDVTPEQRLPGLRALVAWMVLAKRSREIEAGGSDGYEKALKLLRQPIQSKKSQEAGLPMAVLVQSVHPDLLESMVVDLWQDQKFEKGLEGHVLAASSKKSLQVEGLLACYFTLLYYSSQKGKTLPLWCSKVLSAGSSTLENTSSFVFAKAMVAAVPNSVIASMIIPRTIAIYTQLAAKQPSDSLTNLFRAKKNHVSAAALAYATCVVYPATTEPNKVGGRDQLASNAILCSLETILTYQPTAVSALVQAVLDQVNTSALQFEEMINEPTALNRRQAQQEGHSTDLSSQNRRLDAYTVRRVARRLMKQQQLCQDPAILAKVMVLMHAGSSLRTEGIQRRALVSDTLTFIVDMLLPLECQNGGSFRADLAAEITQISSRYHHTMEPSASDKVVSSCLHEAALSLLTSLGGIACNYSPSIDDECSVDDEETKAYILASKLCTDEIAVRLSDNLDSTLKRLESLKERDIALFLALHGVLFVENECKGESNEKKKPSGRRKTEDEEWEEQMKKELAEKKKKADGSSQSTSRTFSPEEKKILEEQEKERRRITKMIEGDFIRVMDSICCLCSSDIEVGNACLPVVMTNVFAAVVSNSPAFTLIRTLEVKSYETLTTLATCVYEIQEEYAPAMAQALRISFRKKTNVDTTPSSSTDSKANESSSDDTLVVSALPSPCDSAAFVVSEMDDFDDYLSGASFAFLFPVIQASLMGPRTIPGCEGALRVLERHTNLLAGDEFDSVVAKLRKEMVISVLEILKHDRSKTFQHPSPYEAIIACYKTDTATNSNEGPALSTGELAPLLDERGALGNKYCRTGSMLALANIAGTHRKLVKNNPLVENRIWFNCFEKEEEIRTEARKAWAVTHDVTEIDDASSLPPPSPLYAAPLLPLLSHTDPSIAHAAADAYAHAMGLRSASVSRNFEILCKTYIDSFPSSSTESDSKTSGTKGNSTKQKALGSIPPPAKKKPNSLLLPKKKTTTKKSALSVAAGIGKPKMSKKKASKHKALLKPKEERTLDVEALESQFQKGPSKTKEDDDSPSKVAIRLGVLLAVASSTKSSVNLEMDEPTLKLLTSFLMAYGIADGNDDVKGAARNALRDVVASNGGSDEAISFLLPHVETVLKTGVADESCLGSLSKEKVPRDVSASDRRKEGAVVALGSIALHLKGQENESKIDSTIDMLISTLKTPSEDVQCSVADALVKLMKKGSTQSRIESILSALLNDCLNGESFAVQRGAAYGLSAAVKGSGIATLKKFEIVKKLEEACSSGGPISKEGSLFAIELLSSRLGLLFEPHVIVLLPSLLKSFSDSSDHVRKAASHTTGLIMSKLSAHGVKLVMPAVLTAFNDPAWRTKEASIRMLGAMSHLAPKQLASALPKVVPKLTEAFSDTHPKVKASAQEALNEISTVIRNPEISSISSVLLKALTDPADNTIRGLEALIETEFLHAIDAPSLSLIVPILHRGLRDRGASAKRFGALIAGNICTMINDPRDFVPYLPTLLPDLQSSLLDPIPDVRSTSAKALGSLTRSLGEHILPELRPWLIKTLRGENRSSAERSGAAQGLTEVLIASGSEVVSDAMRDEILPLRSYPEACTREGVLWMLTFLPPAMGQGFTPLIDESLPALISGLSDDSEQVRDVAMRAGRVLIRSHGKVHVDKILPCLETSLGDDDYQIRLSALSLLGDLLSTIGGTTVVKGDGNTQDDIRRAERAQAQIALVLGDKTRKRVFSGLYLARNDSVHPVRMRAIQVWKTVVSVTARTLRDVLPVLVERIIDDLASGHEEKTGVAGRTLGDVVSKLGDSVLPQIIPVLRNALDDGDSHTKRGVCVGLTEVIKCSTKDQIIRFIEIIVNVVQDAICDEDENVRIMAAESFRSLHSVVGNRALDEVVPSLMVALENENDEISRTRALNGLTGILGIRSRELLPYIIPRLIQSPMTTNHAKALSSIARVTGSTLHFHFSSIIPVLLDDLSEESDDAEESHDAVRQCSEVICASVEDIGVNRLVSEIVSKCGSDKAAMRRECCRMVEVFITERADEADFYEEIPLIVRELVYRLNDDDATVLKANHGALEALSKHVPAEELVKHVEFMRNLINSMVSESRRRKGGVGDGEFLLAGFNIPKGIQPLLPIYSRGILYGRPEIREVCAYGLGEIISLTSTKYLAGPIIIKMTGPLLRIVGDRNPSNVKIAILETLGLVLVKGGPALRAFVPQFQTTFVKALADPSRQVRLEAINALSLLMPLSTRVDPLIKELVSGSLGKNAISSEGLAVSAVQTATLEALATVLEKGGKKAKLPASVPAALEASKELLEGPDDGIREAAAKVMGVACSLLGTDVTIEVLQNNILGSSDVDDSSASRHGKACAIRRILVASAGSEIGSMILENLLNVSLTFLDDDKSIVREAGCVAVGAAIGRSANPESCLQANKSSLMKILGNERESMDIHRAMARGLCVALSMIEPGKRIDFIGVSILDACLKLALSGAQRVQFAYNDVLWLALDVGSGDGGLNQYSALAVFDNVRAMKSLHSKVLTRMKEASTLKE